jgi:putative DNA primase/helicase
MSDTVDAFRQVSTKPDQAHSVETAVLRGARFVTTVEVGEGRAWDEAKVKWLTGGDAISARLMHGNPFTFMPSHKFWIAGNHKPRVRGMDHGFWRRVHFLPFTVTIPKHEQDPDLRDKLRNELPGILRWAVGGCVAWRRAGLRAPDAVAAATSDYRSAEDVIGQFLEERTAPGERSDSAAVFAAYRDWCERTGEKSISAKALNEKLGERGYHRKKSNGRSWTFGLALRAQGDA